MNELSSVDWSRAQFMTYRPEGLPFYKKRKIVIEIKIFIIVFLSAKILRIFLFFRKMF